MHVVSNLAYLTKCHTNLWDEWLLPHPVRGIKFDYYAVAQLLAHSSNV